MQKIKSTSAIIVFLFTGIFVFTACNKEDKRIEEERVKLQQYLEDNGYTGIEPTGSGLYHVVIEEGTGDAPQLTDFINIEFVATLVDGTVFETSDRDLAASRNILRDDKLYGPAKFLLENMGILGLKEGMLLMNEGGTSRFIIPSNLAFGSADLGLIPPYSTLIYDIELLDVISDPVEHEQNLLDQYIENNEVTAIPSESGLFYIEELEGTGDVPGDNASVTLHFKGYLLDGRLFDETSAGVPLVINVSSSTIIPGFVEGIRLMKEDGKARLIIPWDIGFGAEGSGEGIIPPYSTLIFDVEVISIQ